MKYRIGQRVVYIGPDFRGRTLLNGQTVNAPVPEVVYTIRGGVPIHPESAPPEPAYLLEEIRNPVLPRVGEIHVNEKFLRPLTDISKFEELRKAIEAGNCTLVRDKVGA